MLKELFKKQSLTTRIAIGKLFGLLFGAIGFFTLPMIDPESTLMFRIAILCWYTTFGAIIGIFGVFVWHPVLKILMPWWLRSVLIGSWLNFVLALMAYEQIAKITVTFFDPESMFLSPFWIVLEGAIVAFIIDYFATKFGGEGADIVDTKLQ